MSDVLFADDNSAQPAAAESTPAPAAAPTITIPAEVQELVGEGKKYATVEAALASIVPAQQHISTLESENAEYKGKLESNDKLDTILQKLNQPANPTGEVTATPQINMGEIVNAVKQGLQQEATIAQKAENRATVQDKMVAKYGEKAPEELVKAAQSLSMSLEDLTALAETSPSAALQLIGVDAPAPSSQKLTSDLSSAAPAIGGEQAPKTVMFGAKSSEILNAWRASAPTT